MNLSPISTRSTAHSTYVFTIMASVDFSPSHALGCPKSHRFHFSTGSWQVFHPDPEHDMGPEPLAHFTLPFAMPIPPHQQPCPCGPGPQDQLLYTIPPPSPTHSHSPAASISPATVAPQIPGSSLSQNILSVNGASCEIKGTARAGRPPSRQATTRRDRAHSKRGIFNPERRSRSAAPVHHGSTQWENRDRDIAREGEGRRGLRNAHMMRSRRALSTDS